MLRRTPIYTRTYTRFPYTTLFRSLPWNREMAEKIQALMEQENGGLRMTVPPFEFSWEKRKPPEVYALPQPKVLPDKPRQEAPKHRSEEHTSELQSLMRISYAVFCLNKKHHTTS